MRLDNRFGDGQAHTRALYAVSLVRATVKFVEDQAEFRLADSRSLIGHAEEDEVVLLLRADGYRVVRRGIQIRILDEMNKHFLSARKIRPHPQVRIFQFNPDGTSSEDPFANVQRSGNQ